MKSKKEFIVGLISGLIIALFLGSCALCFNIIFNNDSKKTEDVVKETIEKNSTKDSSKKDKKDKKDKKNDKNDKSDQKDSSSDNSDKSNVVTNVADDGYVLSDENVTKKIMLLEDVIDEYYVDSVDNETIEEGIYDGIMESINDPYAAYYSKEEYDSFMNSTEGIYYGIGAYLQYDTEKLYPRITGIIKNSPAESSSLRVDDYITEVNGESIYDMDLSESVALIKGEEGTEVTLTIVRLNTGDEFQETLVRRKVESPTVEYEMLDDNIAYIQIKEFDLVTVDQFAEALAEMKGSRMKGLILDLRGNPGGSLAAAVDIGNMLLPKGLIVYTEDKYGKRDEYKSDGKHEIDVPMVVLVDGNSASASEILAGAIKDYGVGTLMGTTTFGKGIVQRILSLGDGSAVKLTISHYYTPNGNDIHKVGIEPDVEVKFDYDAYIEDVENDNQKQAAFEYLKDEIN